MSEQIQITIDREVYDRLKMLMVPPIQDVNDVIRTLLVHEGHPSPAAIDMEAAGRHFSYEQELERARAGVYECGGCT